MSGSKDVPGSPRVLILSASAGAGHTRAAEPLAGGCRQLAPAAEIRHLDALQLTPAPFRRLYGRGYLDLVNHAPDVVGWLYDRTDRAPRRTAERLRLAIERLNATALARAIRDFAPDVVAHTHFLPAAVMARERRKRRLAAPHAVGRNRSLEQALSRWAGGQASGRVRVAGFTDVMHEWLALADLAVTKPGGLTTSEALACGLPLVVAHAIPGQETRNATMLYEAGAAISGENPHTVAYRVARLLDSAERLRSMRHAAHRLARPHAALDAAREVLRLCGGRFQSWPLRSRSGGERGSPRR